MRELSWDRSLFSTRCEVTMVPMSKLQRHELIDGAKTNKDKLSAILELVDAAHDSVVQFEARIRALEAHIDTSMVGKWPDIVNQVVDSWDTAFQGTMTIRGIREQMIMLAGPGTPPLCKDEAHKLILDVVEFDVSAASIPSRGVGAGDMC